jgi:hypothetical protein
MLMEVAMTAFINYHPRPSPHLATRALYAAAAAAVLIVMALILGLPSTSSGETPKQDVAAYPVFVLPIDPVFAN